LELAIGIDIGGTSTKLALIDKTGHFHNTHSFPTGNKNQDTPYIDRLIDQIKPIITSFNGTAKNLLGIGIGAPSTNEKMGTIEYPANLPFDGILPIVKILTETFSLPTFLIKDASAALLGEYYFGKGRGKENFIMITLGTGLGCGIMVNGKILNGANGLAGELGHVPVHLSDRKCGCGKYGCLETYVSARGLVRTALDYMSKEIIDSPLRKLSFDTLDAKVIYEHAKKGDELAQKVFSITGKLLGQKIAELITLLEPSSIVLAGGLAEAGAILTDPVLATIDQFLLPMHKNLVQVTCSNLPVNHAALSGAASLTWVSSQSSISYTNHPTKII
jgi:glucokinase